MRSFGNEVGASLVTARHLARPRSGGQRAVLRATGVRAIRPFAAAPLALVAATLSLAVALRWRGGTDPVPADARGHAPLRAHPRVGHPRHAGTPHGRRSRRLRRRGREAHPQGVGRRRARRAGCNETYITDDTEALAAAARRRRRAWWGSSVQAKRFNAIRDQLPPDVARKLYLLSVAQTMPAPGGSRRARRAREARPDHGRRVRQGHVLPARRFAAAEVRRRRPRGGPSKPRVHAPRRPVARARQEPQRRRARPRRGRAGTPSRRP